MYIAIRFAVAPAISPPGRTATLSRTPTSRPSAPAREALGGAVGEVHGRRHAA